MKMFLDMDGVVSDAHGAFLKQLGREDLLVPGQIRWLAGIGKVMGISNNEFWRRIDAGGSKLWSEMSVLPWAKHLYEELKKRGDVVFLTAPSRNPECVKGKLEWLHKFTGDRSFEDYVFTRRKELLAASERVLIDDHDENCDKFTQCGGRSFVFPARWQGLTDDEIREGVTELLTKL